jgi:hypothetical protein
MLQATSVTRRNESRRESASALKCQGAFEGEKGEQQFLRLLAVLV